MFRNISGKGYKSWFWFCGGVAAPVIKDWMFTLFAQLWNKKINLNVVWTVALSWGDLLLTDALSSANDVSTELYLFNLYPTPEWNL